jgi:peptidoglycan L-alanyl-D-glutamate endopeptidase CwlK
MINSRLASDLHLIVETKAIEHIKRCKDRGINIILTSTLRDDEYQGKLYEQGRSAPGQIVTNMSRTGAHGLGLAYDVVPVDVNGNAIWSDDRLWNIIGEEGVKLGFVWGGNWKSFVDSPHFELTDGLKYSDLREGKRPAWFNNPSFYGYVAFRTKFEGQTMDFLDAYKYADPLFERLAKLL